MYATLVDELRCPDCGRPLRLTHGDGPDGAVMEGRLECSSDHAFAVRGFVPRLVAGHYAGSFGFQWAKHARTQLDRYNGTTISRDRFTTLTGWDLKTLKGQRVLEVGSGAGRFTQILCDAGAAVYSVELSDAIDVNLANNGRAPSHHYIQGDMYQLPFAPGGFDCVVCLNVLQHTPDVPAAFRALCAQVRPGGRLAINVYKKSWKAALNWKYALRPITRHLPARFLYGAIRAAAPVLLALSRLSARPRALHAVARRLLPIHDYRHALPQLGPTAQREWAVLDTFDSLAPRYDHPLPPGTLRTWFTQAGFEIEWDQGEGCTVAGRRPHEPDRP